MAEQASKRQRQETLVPEESDSSKRHKSYNHILSILEEEEEDESNQDLSDIFKTLQQELSNDLTSSDPLSFSATETTPHQQQNTVSSNKITSSRCSKCSNVVVRGSDEEDSKELGLIRHLFEASDDELGIPNTVDGGGDMIINGGDHWFPFCDGLWEFEDQAANYFALLQSDLFM